MVTEIEIATDWIGEAIAIDWIGDAIAIQLDLSLLVAGCGCC